MANRRSLLAGVAQKAKAASGDTAPAEKKSPRQNLLAERGTILNEIIDDGRRNVVHMSVDPAQCRMWRRHNRLYDRLDKTICEDLIESIKQHGQKNPAIARRLINDLDGYEYEIIAGARRHWAVNYLRDQGGLPDLGYLIEVKKLSDLEAFHVSDSENKDRLDISDYERALDYASASKEFYGGKISEFSKAIGMKRQTLSQYLYVADFPEEVIAAYADPLNIALRHATVLTPMLKDKTKRQHIITCAREISQEQSIAKKLGGTLAYDGAKVMKKLKDAGEVTQVQPLPRKISKVTIEGSDGRSLLSIEKGKRYVTVKIPVDSLDKKKDVMAGLKKIW